MNRIEFFLKDSKAKKFYENCENIECLGIIKIEEFEFKKIGHKNESAQIGHFFAGRNDYFELSFSVELPSLEKDSTWIGCFDLGKTGYGFNEGFESVLLINDNPIQGVDTFHNRVEIKSDFVEKKCNFLFKIWTGFDGGGTPQILEHRVKKIEFCMYNKFELDLVDLYKCLYETFLTLKPHEKGYKVITTEMWKIYSFFNFEKNIEPSLLFTQIKRELQKNKDDQDYFIDLFGHAHIDLAWLWTKKNAIEKSVRTFTTMLDLMEKYPDFKFLQSTPQMYQWIKEKDPILFDRILQKIKLGQFEPEGAMWVEADCNIPSGESLARQLIYGKKFFDEEFNIDSRCLWLPDVFGYSWALPQLLSLSGVNSFMTTKISWNQYNKMPCETFYWKGIDGTSILTHFMTTPEPTRSYTWNKTYTAVIEPFLLKESWNRYEDKEINNAIPVAYGYGDGGGGVSDEMIRKIDLLNFIPTIPKLEMSNLAEAIENIKSNVEKTDSYVHEWDGELYLEYHRGTFTTQASVKKHNRDIEIILRELELLSEYSRLNNIQPIELEKFETYWKVLLTNQFHDIIPGSSITEVYEEAEIEYLDLRNKLCIEKQNLLEKISSVDANEWTIFNTSSFDQEGLIRIKKVASNKFLKNICFYESIAYYYIISDKVESLSFLQKSNQVSKVNSKEITSDGNLETDRYSLTFKKGVIIYIYDKKNKRIVSEDYINKLVVYSDIPHRFDAWDIDLDYSEKKYDLEFISMFQYKLDQSRTLIKNLYSFNKSTISQEIIIDDESGAIFFDNIVNWKENNKLLRVENKVNIMSKVASYETQFGTIKRPNNWNTSWEMAKFEVVGHHFADISELNYGVALINDSKYGYSCKDNELSLSLLRSPKYPDITADIGEHVFSYGILPHINQLENSTVYSHAEMFNGYLTASNNSFKNDLVPDFMKDFNDLKVAAVKESFSGEGTIIRLYEFKGATINLDMSRFIGYKVEEICLLEKNIIRQYETSETACFSPFEVKTFRVSK